MVRRHLIVSLAVFACCAQVLAADAYQRVALEHPPELILEAGGLATMPDGKGHHVVQSVGRIAYISAPGNHR